MHATIGRPGPLPSSVERLTLALRPPEPPLSPPFVRGGSRGVGRPPLKKGGQGGVETLATPAGQGVEATTARPRGRATYAIHSLSALALCVLGTLHPTTLRADGEGDRRPALVGPGNEAGLRLPSADNRPPEQVAREFYDFLVNRRYSEWEHDRDVRDTGDYLKKILGWQK